MDFTACNVLANQSFMTGCILALWLLSRHSCTGHLSINMDDENFCKLFEFICTYYNYHFDHDYCHFQHHDFQDHYNHFDHGITAMKIGHLQNDNIFHIIDQKNILKNV